MLWLDVDRLETEQANPFGLVQGEAASRSPLDEVAAALAAAPPPARPGDSAALQLAAAMLRLAQSFQANPPTVNMASLQAYQEGRIGREELELSACPSLRPSLAPAQELQQLAAEVERACAAPGACTPAAADLLYHPLRRDLQALAAKAGACPPVAAPAR